MAKVEKIILSHGGYSRVVRFYAPKNASILLYAHDGQNMFFDEEAAFGKSWKVLDAVKRVGLSGKVAIAAIDCDATSDTARMNDYFPVEKDDNPAFPDMGGGKAEEYCEFLEQYVYPYIEKRGNYKTKAVVGSSAGGIMSLMTATRKTDISVFGIFSNAYCYSPEKLSAYFAEHPLKKDGAYYVYSGGNEIADNIPETRRLLVDSAADVLKLLLDSGVTDYRVRIESDGEHNESTWRKYLPDFMAYLKSKTQM